MEAITCELCGSHDLMKTDGCFVCQHCGVKYSLEEARRMAAHVDVSGSVVKIDATEELHHLQQLARRAREDHNCEKAQQYYEMILLQNPNSWEAAFYAIYFQVLQHSVAEIDGAFSILRNSLNSVFLLVKSHSADDAEQGTALSEISSSILSLCNEQYDASCQRFESKDKEGRNRHQSTYLKEVFAFLETLYALGDQLEKLFGQRIDAMTLAEEAWKQGVAFHTSILGHLEMRHTNEYTIEIYTEKIKKRDPSYQKPSVPFSGCYIATCVYGSYDCPQVLLLRKWRDDHLAHSVIGRRIMTLYYAISPWLVRQFGGCHMVRCLWRLCLDPLVHVLNQNISTERRNHSWI